MERIAGLILDESKWLALAMVVALGVVALRFGSKRRQELPRRAFVLWAMTLFYGCMIGIMASGHLLAVTVKVLQGTLEGSPLYLYPLGFVLAVPSWWLAFGAGGFVRDVERNRRTLLTLNVWLGLSLLGLGLHNWPLAAPAALNSAYQLHARRAVGWTIVAVALAGNLLLFLGALVFLVSGQSFEQFKGMD